ncbi:uncharacterized protein LOC113294790 [Papaver somniferum]|uniref:uncharacterized protein LOC113294790 n=1 Tax=Papaver somniferum TaxID=3469 RepID=UPI000E6F6886|nr:uncharacterized protein LOC113294790 [Papaver somniferum]
MVWVRFPGLGLEFWNEKILFTICNEIGTPIKVDNATARCEVGYYVNVLVEVGFSQHIPSKGGPIGFEKNKNVGEQEHMVPIIPKEMNISNQEKSNTTEKFNPKEKPNPIPFDICDFPSKEDSIVKTIQNTIPASNSCGEILSQQSKISPLEIEDNVEVPEAIIIEVPSQTTVEAVNLESNMVKFVDGTNGTVVITPVQVISWAKVVEKNKVNSTSDSGSPSAHLSMVEKEMNKSIAQPQVISVSSQMITVSVGDVLVSGVHAHVKVVQRRFLWSEMQLRSDLNKPWIILGDFNAVIAQEEKVGGKASNRNAMLEFSECLNQCELLPAPKTGLQFSWSNCQQGSKIILCALDRVVFNQKWLQLYGDWGYKIGMRIISDHAPLLGVLGKDNNRGSCFSVLAKIEGIKKEALNNLVKAQNEHASREVQANTLLRQKSRVKWIKEREANTSLFHTNMKIRNSINMICELEDKDGNMIADQEKIVDLLVNHFQEKFQYKPVEYTDKLLDVIPKVINEEDQKMLEDIPKEEDIKEVVFDIDQENAPGPDGFSARISVMVNGGPCGFFPMERGLKQGDPISPIMFVIMEEVLSRNISALVERGELQPMVTKKVMREKSLLNLLKLLDCYQVSLGQIINKAKSKLFVDDTDEC